MDKSAGREVPTLLIVDDGASNHSLIEAILADDDYRFLLAADADKALQLLRSERVDLVLVDVLVPGSDGFEVCRHIRRDESISDVPVVIMTTLGDQQARVRGYDAGADDFLFKPLDSHELKARVRSITRLNRYRRIVLERNELTVETLRPVMAGVDRVSGLPTLALFEEQLGSALRRADLAGFAVAVLTIRINEFDELIGVYDKPEIALLVRELADKLTRAIKGRGMVGRVDKRTFVACQPIPRVEELMTAVHHYRRSVNGVFEIGDNRFGISTSIGACVYPTDSDDPEKLVSLATGAMSQARKRGGNHFQLVAPSARDDVKRRLELESKIYEALEKDNFELHYQPRLRMRDSRVVSVEALLRMRDEGGGFISPGVFMPVATESGLMDDVGRWALRQACADGAAIMRDGFPDMRVAVNLTGELFRNTDLLAELDHHLQKNGLSGKNLELEVTESALRPDGDVDLESLCLLMSEIKTRGITLAVDDFGTGFSSLTYLRHFPIDALKVDRSFINLVPGDGKATAVVRSIIALGRNLELTVVAEGVETDAQIRTLREAGCDDAQGFLYARPVPLTKVVEILREFEHDPTEMTGNYSLEDSD